MQDLACNLSSFVTDLGGGGGGGGGGAGICNIFFMVIMHVCQPFLCICNIFKLILREKFKNVLN